MVLFKANFSVDEIVAHIRSAPSENIRLETGFDGWKESLKQSMKSIKNFKQVPLRFLEMMAHLLQCSPNRRSVKNIRVSQEDLLSLSVVRKQHNTSRTSVLCMNVILCDIPTFFVIMTS